MSLSIPADVIGWAMYDRSMANVDHPSHDTLLADAYQLSCETLLEGAGHCFVTTLLLHTTGIIV